MTCSKFWTKNSGHTEICPKWPDDISEFTYSGIFYDFQPESLGWDGKDIKISSDGTMMYIAVQGRIIQYLLADPTDVSTAVFVYKYTNSVVTSYPAICFSKDGTKLFICSVTDDYVRELTLSNAWDLSTAVVTGTKFYTATEEDNIQGLEFSPDGLNMYIVGYSNDTIYQYSLSTPWDITTCSLFGSLYAGSGSPSSLVLSSNGDKIYAGSNSAYRFQQIDLSTPLDITTGVIAGKYLYTISESGAMEGWTFSPDGAMIIAVDTVNLNAYQYNIN